MKMNFFGSQTQGPVYLVMNFEIFELFVNPLESAIFPIGKLTTIIIFEL
jgi:hypothetical protein